MRLEDVTNLTARCFHGEPASCSHPCPFFFDVRTFLARAKDGKWGLAYKLYRNAVVFPGIVSELCEAPCRAECQRGPGAGAGAGREAPCRTECQRGPGAGAELGPGTRLEPTHQAPGPVENEATGQDETAEPGAEPKAGLEPGAGVFPTTKDRLFFMGDEPVDIRAIEVATVRFARDRQPETYRIPPRDKRVAIIGAGLAGLSLALNLSQKAWPVTVFERGGQALASWAGHPKYECFLEEIKLQFSTVSAEFVYGREISGLDDPALAGFDYVYDASGGGNGSKTAIGERLEEAPVGFEQNSVAIVSLGFDQCAAKTKQAMKGGNAVQAIAGSNSTQAIADGNAVQAIAGSNSTQAIAGGNSVQADGNAAQTGGNAVQAIASGVEISKTVEAFLQTGKWPDDEGTARPEKHYIDHKGEPGKAIIIAGDPLAGYTKEEASAEAARCLGCDCRACMDACEMLGRYNKRPQKIAVEAYSDTKSAPPISSCTLTRQTYSCNLCGHCREVCPVGADIEKLFFLARAGRAETGKHPKVFHDFWLRDFEWHSREAAYFSSGATEDHRFLFFPGCKLGARSPSQVQGAAAFLKERFGAGILLDCCGAPAYWAGEEGLFRMHLGSLRAKWEASGRPTFVLACAYCMRLFAEFLPEVQIVSLYELLLKTGGIRELGTISDRFAYAAENLGKARGKRGLGTGSEGFAFTTLKPGDTSGKRGLGAEPTGFAVDALKPGDTSGKQELGTESAGFAVEALKPGGTSARRLVVFDPCMARGFPEMEASVRKLAEDAGASLVELSERNRCCGYGGHMRTANQELYDTIVSNRSSSDEAPFLVYCANCAETFAATGKAHVHILDIVFPKQGHRDHPSGSDCSDGMLHERDHSGLDHPPDGLVSFGAPGALQRQRANALMTKVMLSDLYEGKPFVPTTPPWASLRVDIPLSLSAVMDRQLILPGDIKEAIYEAERSGEVFILPGSKQHGAPDAGPHGTPEGEPHGAPDAGPHGTPEGEPHGALDVGPNGTTEGEPHGALDVGPNGAPEGGELRQCCLVRPVVTTWVQYVRSNIQPTNDIACSGQHGAPLNYETASATAGRPKYVVERIRTDVGTGTGTDAAKAFPGDCVFTVVDVWNHRIGFPPAAQTATEPQAALLSQPQERGTAFEPQAALFSQPQERSTTYEPQAALLSQPQECAATPAAHDGAPDRLQDPETTSAPQSASNGWTCGKCSVPLSPKNTLFSYMGMTFSHEAQRCAKCGMVFISKELADGRMAEVEQLMEDK